MTLFRLLLSGLYYLPYHLRSLDAKLHCNKALTLKAPIMTADDSLEYLFFIFQRK